MSLLLIIQIAFGVGGIVGPIYEHYSHVAALQADELAALPGAGDGSRICVSADC